MHELVVMEPAVHADDRGFFLEAYNRRDFAQATGDDVEFVQDNLSRSVRGVLRGLHYQVAPHPQGKLVRVVEGAIFDVAVDIRRSSPTFLDWAGVELSADNRRHLWIPAGFAHGFLVLSESAQVLYKTTDYYEPTCDRSIRWDDPRLAIAWPSTDAPLVSDKDAHAPLVPGADLFP
jgi:dTDP-4-dehydrorhamnose 3,5-epimerase